MCIIQNYLFLKEMYYFVNYAIFPNKRTSVMVNKIDMIKQLLKMG